METHLILKRDFDLRYHVSKWNRSVGDRLIYESKTMEVIFVGTGQECRTIIAAARKAIKAAKARARYQQDKADREWLIKNMAKAGAEIGLDPLDVAQAIKIFTK